MSKKIFFTLMLAVALVLAACTPSIPGVPTSPAGSPTSMATLPSAATSTTVPSATLPPATVTPIPGVTSVPTTTGTGLQSSDPSAANYIDDLSTPSQVIVSYYNAINRKEYLRAYSYYQTPDTTLGSYTSFASGYQNTASVELVFGQITGDPGMSQIYYTVPVILKVTATDSTRSNYAACYVVHETNPGVYGAPPISPMGINSGSATASDINASDASVLANACSAYPSGGLISTPASSNSLSIDASNFVDNRSGPIETVSSLLNAINLKQYVRAYSYFQTPATFPGNYETYAGGFANTGTITVTFGSVTSEGAAGSTYYKVPLAETVLTTSNSTQTFVGCYTLRLSNPSVQGVPPFQPMGIVTGEFTQVPNNSDVNSMLPTACN